MYLSSCIINWKIGSATATLLLNIYVDDLALCGDERCHSGFWTELPQAVKLEPGPYILGREGTLIIGRKHYLKVTRRRLARERKTRFSSISEYGSRKK